MVSKNNNIFLDNDKLNIVVAFTNKNKYISYNNELPWKMKLRGDNNFINLLIRLETNCVLIMGRKTFESIPKYKNLLLYVITSKKFDNNNVKCFKKFNDAILHAKSQNLVIIIFGGSEIYKEAINYEYKIFCTIVNEDNLLGDNKFPEINVSLINISEEVNNFLLKNNIKETWKLDNINNIFEENEIKYSFYYGYS